MEYVADNKVGTLGTRGIIIVDSSALFNCIIEISDDRFLTPEGKTARDAGKPQRLVDALTLLARNGYEIIIPEMVAYECGNMMRDGKTMNYYFPNSEQIPLMQHAITFLQKVPALGDKIYIAPPPAQDMTDPAQYIRSIWKAHTETAIDYSVSNRYKNTPRKNSVDLQRINRIHKALQVIAADKLVPNTDNYGDIAACELVRHMKKPHIPVFYLSNDRMASETISALRADVPVNRLSCSGLIQAFKDNGLLGFINIADCQFSKLSDYIEDEVHNLESDHDKNHRNINNAQDEMPQGRNFTIMARPFAENLKGLREEIAKNGSGKPVQADDIAYMPEPVAAEPTAAQLRAAKWGSFVKAGNPTDGHKKG